LAQGDLVYGSAANTFSALTKNTTATRYLANTGTNNNPAWAQIDLSNGVTGILPAGNGGTGNGFTAFTGPTTSTKTFTLPDATDTVVGKATSDIFSNKTIDTANSNTVKINGNTLSASAGPQLSLFLIHRILWSVVPQLILLPTKQIDAQGTGNSLTNITDTNIKTGANISRAKLASGSANQVIINDGSGVLSSEAALSDGAPRGHRHGSRKTAS
jgi:hypothetical protein